MKSYEVAGTLAKMMGKTEFQDEGKPTLLGLWETSLGLLVSNLYFAFGNFAGYFYLVLLLGLLILIANRKKQIFICFLLWWGWLESNQLPSGYEPPALTDELQPHTFAYYSLFRPPRL